LPWLRRGVLTPDYSRFEICENLLELLPPIQNLKEFYQSLGIPYRTVAIVSGELNNAAAKKCGYWGGRMDLDQTGFILTWGYQTFSSFISCFFPSISALLPRRYDLEGWFPGDAEGKGKPSA
jgi:hypothetical protein